jgi:hypothetical protein
MNWARGKFRERRKAHALLNLAEFLWAGFTRFGLGLREVWLRSRPAEDSGPYLFTLRKWRTADRRFGARGFQKPPHVGSYILEGLALERAGVMPRMARMLPMLLAKGGLMMWLLLATSAVAIAIFVERVLHYHRAQINTAEFWRGCGRC